MKRSILLVFLFLLLSVSLTEAQSLTGVTGLLNAPSANMLKDGTFYAGTNYLNRNYINTYGHGLYNCLIYYFDLTFLPFLEINFRNTRMLGNNDGSHTVDRMISLKLRVLKERKYWPSIALGANDIYTGALIGNQNFGSIYAVTSKNIPIKKSELGLTVGYAVPYFENTQFAGVFGGITFSPSFMRQVTVMAEYDTRSFNIGGSVLFFKHLYVFALLQGLEGVSGGIAYRISAWSGVKSLKRKSVR